MNNTLLKLNNEYVKLYVTLNSKLPELLKNSGALIVYHNNNSNNNQKISDKKSDDNNNEIVEIKRLENLYTNNDNNLGTNYLYLGNEVIASGWGFDNEKQKDFVIENLNVIPERINSIIDVLNKIIGNSKQQLYVSKEGDLGSYENLYISKNYFPSNILNNENNENNEDNEDNYKIKIKDLPKLLYKADYTQEEIVSIECSIKEGISYENDKFNKCFYVPYNCNLTYIITIQYNVNDAGTLNHIKFNDESINVIKSSDVNNINSSYVTNIGPTDNSTYNTITISKEITNVTDIKNPIIDLVFDKNENEKKYKTYPYLENLYSIEHIIPKHTVRLNSLFDIYKIVPKDIIYGNDIKLIEGNIINDDETFSYIGKLEDFNIPQISNFINKKLIIDEDNIIFEINNTNNTTNNELNSNLMIFVIPSKYNVENITLYSKDNIINKNIVNNFKIIYNCLKYNDLLHNIIYAVIDLNNNQQYYLKFKVSENNIENNNLNTDNNNLLNNLLYNNTINKTWYLINDNTGFCWFNGPENNYMLNIINNLLFNYNSKQDNNSNKDLYINNYENRFYLISNENNTALDQVLSLL